MQMRVKRAMKMSVKSTFEVIIWKHYFHYIAQRFSVRSAFCMTGLIMHANYSYLYIICAYSVNCLGILLTVMHVSCII